MMPSPSSMDTLAVALLGASGTAALRLASALANQARSSRWPVRVEVLADTPALPSSLACFDLLLLAGVEPAAAGSTDPLSARAAQLEREAADQSIRGVLIRMNASYQVLYGTYPERLAQALRALEPLLPPGAARLSSGMPPRAGAAPSRARPWVWSCDKCSDPQCEYKLLSDLLVRRNQAG